TDVIRGVSGPARSPRPNRVKRQAHDAQRPYGATGGVVDAIRTRSERIRLYRHRSSANSRPWSDVATWAIAPARYGACAWPLFRHRGAGSACLLLSTPPDVR